MTYSNPGARLEVLLPQLSRAARLKLLPAAEMKGIPVVVLFQDVPVDAALEKIAFATRGVWRLENGAQVLHEDTTAIKKEQEEAMAKHLAVMHKIWAGLRGNADPTHPQNPHDGRVGNDTPPYVAVGKIIPYLDEDAVVKLDQEQRLVYSTRPRPLQRPLSVAVTPIVADMIKGLNSEGPVGPDHVTRKIVGVPYKTNIIVTAEADGRFELIEVQITVYDKDSRLLTSQQALGISHEMTGGGFVLASDTEVARPLNVDPVYLDVLRYWHENAEPTPAVIKFVDQPLLHDPIEPEGATLIAYAQMHHVQLVAAITDLMTYAWMKYGAKVETDSGFIHSILQGWDWEPKDGWIVARRTISTVMSDANDGKIMDRHKLQRLTDALPSMKRQSLYDKVRAQRIGFDELDWPVGPHLPQFELAAGLTTWPGNHLSSALALLSDGQISDLLKGKRVAIAKTSAAFQRRFEECTEGSHGHDAALLIHDSSMSPKPAGNADFVYEQDREFTDVADKALPTGVYMRLVHTDTFAAEVSSPGWARGAKFNLGQLAEDIVSDWGVDQVRVLRERDYELRYYVTPNLYFSDTGAVYEKPDNAPFISIKNLPPELVTALKPYLEESRQWHEKHGK